LIEGKSSILPRMRCLYSSGFSVPERERRDVSVSSWKKARASQFARQL
jgi:hypothetical protein